MEIFPSLFPSPPTPFLHQRIRGILGHLFHITKLFSEKSEPTDLLSAVDVHYTTLCFSSTNLIEKWYIMVVFFYNRTLELLSYEEWWTPFLTLVCKFHLLFHDWSVTFFAYLLSWQCFFYWFAWALYIKKYKTLMCYLMKRFFLSPLVALFFWEL